IALFGLADASPAKLMYIWDAFALAFLFSWSAGVLAELQRAEVVSLEKFLHLPISLRGIFIFNYLNTLISVTAVILVPPMVGCTIGLIFSRGPAFLLLIPLLAAFLLMVTALTYQFQGWLASLMANKRRRRTITVLITASFILIAQLPQLVSVYHPWKNLQNAEQ